jgi:hypothetical protein
MEEIAMKKKFIILMTALFLLALGSCASFLEGFNAGYNAGYDALYE